MKGINRANRLSVLARNFSFNETKAAPNELCVFLSHKSQDKPACREIAKYLSQAEIDYYLDEEDAMLQQAAAADDAHRITESLKKGIRESTHMIVVISKITFTSPWIPFEVGFGHSAIIDKDLHGGLQDKQIKLSILTLKDIASELNLPGFVKTCYEIKGTKSLNEYILKITGQSEHKMFGESLIVKHMYSHPLDKILNWEL